MVENVNSGYQQSLMLILKSFKCMCKELWVWVYAFCIQITDLRYIVLQ